MKITNFLHFEFCGAVTFSLKVTQLLPGFSSCYDITLPKKHVTQNLHQFMMSCIKKNKNCHICAHGNTLNGRNIAMNV